MTLTIRGADLQTDRGLLIEAISRYLTPLSTEQRFDWLYMDNPYGKARAWIATDSAQQTVVGVASAFPRVMSLCGNETLGWVLGDFCINPRYRSLGPALELQRACVAGVDSGTTGVWYDFPSESMVAVYRRLGIAPAKQMVRLAKLLRSDRKVKERVRFPGVAGRMSACANLFLALRDWRPFKSGSVETREHVGKCGEEFTELFLQSRNEYGVCVKRSAEYLNWRFIDNPLRHYTVMSARRQGRLMAYCVVTCAGEDAVIADLFGIRDRAVLDGLVDSIVEFLRSAGIVTVSVPVSAAHPCLEYLCRRGFSRREICPVMVCLPRLWHKETRCGQHVDVVLTSGDRES